ncbi:MAG: TatD DNase family protein [Parcubacteria group bacterium Gr01-1014_49]|nr:MAG: TatD DNase family protein [Parcubacteria group bacterium Gr01-1014_49]
MNGKYIDAHCHIQFEQYAEDDTALIERMAREGVLGIVVGVDLDSSKKAVALAEKHEHLFASVGLHPNRVLEESFDEAAYRALAAHPKVVAIGECGLDFFRPAEVNEEVKRKQKEALNTHIELASALDKPLIIHSRPSKGTQDAYEDLIALLKEAKKEHPSLRGDIHFFVGGIREAEALVALDFTLSFTAVITFARDYDAVIRAVPLASILSETDSPYVAPASRRGERNDPLAIKEIVLKIADIRNEDPETVRAAVLENARRLFLLA